MNVPFTDLNLLHKKLHRDITRAINKVIQRGDFILGQETGLFEKEFAKVCGCQFALGVNSGTDALFLTLKAMDIKEGDEVIVPAFTYIATAFAVSYTGAKPVFVDIEEHTYNIDASKIKNAITPRTKAIIPVHLYGQPANMPQILKIAKEHNLKVVEDAAQAHGAEILLPDGKWHACGSMGDCGCFSFYPTKNLGALGDGGIITANNEEIYKKLFKLRDYGRVSKYYHSSIGYNCRLDTLQAAVLRIKLGYLNTWNSLRKEVALEYNRLLSGINGLVTPFENDNVKHIYHVYALRAAKRDELAKYLSENGISALVHYPVSLHLQEAYKDLGYKKGDFPFAEKIALEIISLPIYPYMKKTQIKYVAAAINEFIKITWKK